MWQMVGAAVLTVLVLTGVLVFGFYRAYADEGRITGYIRERGGRVVGIRFAPFGKGWFGEKEERMYEVVYYDKAGNQHFATCKTSMFTGVFWTDDRITHRKSKWYESLSPGNEPGNPLIGQIPKELGEDPADELRRLREENARLRAKLAGPGDARASIQPGACPACGASISPDAARCPDCQIALR